jgi:hypothetical protein
MCRLDALSPTGIDEILHSTVNVFSGSHDHRIAILHETRHKNTFFYALCKLPAAVPARECMPLPRPAGSRMIDDNAGQPLPVKRGLEHAPISIETILFFAKAIEKFVRAQE